MNNLSKLFLLPFLFTLLSCEEVVNIELETADSRLVINAPLQWEKGTEGNYQSITLSTTAGFYESTPPKVSGAVVSVMDSNGSSFIFEEGETPGLYECFDFKPQLFGEYELEVIFNSETYIGTEVLLPVPDFDSTEQKPMAFADMIEIRAYFTDPEDQENFYLLEETSSSTITPAYQAFNDEFFNGQQNYASHFDEDLDTEDFVRFKLYGISSRHHDYLFNLISSYQGGPFQTVPGLLKGNIKNITNEENFPFGYFSLSETSDITHILN